MARYNSQDNEQLAIFGTILLTIIVWVYMYIRRIHFFKSTNFPIEQIKRPEDLARVSPLVFEFLELILESKRLY